MEATAQFDVEAVVHRLVSSLPLRGAPFEVADWALNAAGRVKQWAESVQAEAYHERQQASLAPPLPDPAAEPGTDAASDTEPTTEPDADAADGAGADAACEDAGTDEPLPSLGPGAAPDTAAEHERLARRSKLLAELLLLAAAFREGRISTGHIEVLAMQLVRVDDGVRQRVFDREADLLAAALTTSVDGFARMVRKEIARASDDEGAGRLRDQRQRSLLRHWVRGDDMHALYLELDPERGAPLFAALDAEIAALYASGAAKGLSREQVAVTAFCNLQARTAEAPVSASDESSEQQPAPTDADAADAERHLDASTSGQRGRVRTRRRSSATKGQLVVLIDIMSLVNGSHDRTICEAASGVPLPPSVARQMMCRAAIVYGLTYNGRLVGMSSKQRLATDQQRVMLRMMYRTCAFPDCEVPVKDCEVHHVMHAAKGGATAVETMIPLCRHRHHDAVHDDGWKVRIDAQRTLTWVRPGGEVFEVVPFVGLADLDDLPVGDAGAGPPAAEPTHDPPVAPTLFDGDGSSAA